MSDTPRTDAIRRRDNSYDDLADFAQQLEIAGESLAAALRLAHPACEYLDDTTAMEAGRAALAQWEALKNT